MTSPAAELIPKEADKQNKDYCMLCYKSFGVFTFRYHCRPCGRSCCGDCSLQVKVRMSVGPGAPSNYRVCEYCDIKTENPQLEEYYRLECQLRQNDQEVVVEKIKWLKKTSKELERQIAQQREDISLLQASAKRQIEEVQAKIDQLNADKLRLEKLKEQLIKSIEETAQEVKQKDAKVKELQAKRSQKLVELDKVKNKLEQKDKELKELIKEISKYDADFHSEVGSFLDGNNNNGSILHNESVINELSFIDPHNQNTKSMLIEKGAIGGGNNSKAAPADNGDEAGYFQFETPENTSGLVL